MQCTIMRSDGVFDAERFDSSRVLKAKARDGGSALVRSEAFVLEA
jgi:hypothetical protein